MPPGSSARGATAPRRLGVRSSESHRSVDPIVSFGGLADSLDLLAEPAAVLSRTSGSSGSAEARPPHRAPAGSRGRERRRAPAALGIGPRLCRRPALRRGLAGRRHPRHAHLRWLARRRGDLRAGILLASRRGDRRDLAEPLAGDDRPADRRARPERAGQAAGALRPLRAGGAPARDPFPFLDAHAASRCSRATP